MNRFDRLMTVVVVALLAATVAYVGWHVAKAGDFWNASSPASASLPAPAPAPVPAPADTPAAPVEPACQEDDPCWDCKTMGNLICGPTSAVIENDGSLSIFDRDGELITIVSAANVSD